jgi:hypothetical protein
MVKVLPSVLFSTSNLSAVSLAPTTQFRITLLLLTVPVILMSFAGATVIVDAGSGERLVKGAILFVAYAGWYAILRATKITKAVNFVIS